MTAGERQLTLVVPLQAAHSDAACHWIQAQGEQLPCARFDALTLLLTRAEPIRLGSNSLANTLCDWFGIATDTGTPSAALRWLADTGHLADSPLLCLDPVQLVADRDHVLLYDSAMLELGQDEAGQLVESLNDFLRDDGLQLVATTPSHWYLRGVPGSHTVFTPLDDVVGRNILPAMPRGDAAPYWRRLLNEIQVWLHAQPLNIARAERGLPVLNGVWPWGAGEIMRKGPARFGECFTGDTVVQGMASLQGSVCQAACDGFADWQSRSAIGASLVMLPPTHATDPDHLCRQLQALESQWFVPLAQALHSAQLQQLILITGTSTAWRVDARRFHQAWRHWFSPARDLSALCDTRE